MSTPGRSAAPPPEPEPGAPRLFRLKLAGVGGAGNNAVHEIAAARAAGRPVLAGVDLLAINTDVQALDAMTGCDRLQIGAAITRGLGAGGDPEIGARAAQHDTERLEAALQNADVVFLAAGLGGGTGTGASPVIARVAREQGALVLAFVALPFSFEGKRRGDQAAIGLEQLKAQADAVICIHNDRLFKILGGGTAPATEAFRRGNEIIGNGVQAIWQLLSRKGLINLDFADLRATLGGKHCEGIFSHGEAQGTDRARDAIKQLLENPLFDANETLTRAEGVLVSICGGPDLSLADVQRAVEPISRLAQRAHVIMGAAIDEAQCDRLSVTVIASTGNVAKRLPQSVTSRVPAAARSLAARVTYPSVAPSAPATVAETQTALKKEGQKPVSRGRFDKDTQNLYNGEDLDVPTFLRRGVPLNR